MDINTGAGTPFELLVDSDIAVLGDKVFFSTSDADLGEELFIYDCSAPRGSELMIIDIVPGARSSSPNRFTVIGEKVFFVALDDVLGTELFFYDCTAPLGSELTIVDVNTGDSGSVPFDLTVVGDKLFFTAFDTSIGFELFIYDCSAPMGSELTRVDVSTAPGGSSFPSTITAVGDKVVFRGFDPALGAELFIYDCGALGNELTMMDLNAGAGSSNPLLFIVANNKVFFSAEDVQLGRELFIYDCAALPGSEITTVDINTGSESSFPENFTVVDDKVFFMATGGVDVDEQLFIYDCSAPIGNELNIVDINPGLGSVPPRDFTVLGDKVFFSADDVDLGRELFIYDCSAPLGSELTTVDINPGADNSNPSEFTAVGDKVFFGALGGDNVGFELFIYDCSAMLGRELTSVDIFPGAASSGPGRFTPVGDKLFFRAFGEDNIGSEFFIYDCSASLGSELSNVDINPGVATSSPDFLAVVDDKVFFSANDGTSETKLHIATCFSEDDAGFTFPTSVCIDDINPIATITGVVGGDFSVDNGATIDIVTGELDLSSTTVGTSYTVTYTNNNIGTCPSSFEQIITVEACVVVPTLGEWGVIWLSLLLMIIGGVFIRQSETKHIRL